jgi:hypothetical protein
MAHAGAGCATPDTPAVHDQDLKATAGALGGTGSADNAGAYDDDIERLAHTAIPSNDE